MPRLILGLGLIWTDELGTDREQVMRFAEVGKSEGQLAAEFEYQCAVRGSERPAYVPVVASGWVC